MYVCSECSLKLRPTEREGRRFYVCPNCLGRLIGFGQVRYFIGERGAGELWRASEHIEATGRPCPSCSRPLRPILSHHKKLNFEVDVCRICHILWLDQGEDAHLYSSAEIRKKVHMEPHELQEYAQAVAGLASERYKEPDSLISTSGPNEIWKWIPGLLGLPIEIDERRLRIQPVTLWLVLIFILAVFVRSLGPGSLERLISSYAFIPDEAYRHFGFTWISSFFLHGGFLHMLGNFYYLLIFSDDVEDDLQSSMKFLGLLFGAHWAGLLLHMVATGNGKIPLLGASAGVFGVLAYYVMRFPQTRIGLFYIFLFKAYWLRFSAKWLVLFKVLMEVALTSVMWKKTGGGVAHAAHVGGALFGFVIGYMANLNEKTPSKKRA